MVPGILEQSSTIRASGEMHGSLIGGRLSSVFDIKTKDANVEKLSGEASIGPVTGNFVLETPLVKDKSAILLGARATYADWILRSLDDEELN